MESEVTTRPGSAGGDSSYEGLLKRADKLAEGGNCRAASTIYERALDKNPAGVAALTGLGYCHLDGKDYGRAFAKFRAALGVSPRYQAALWGMAETYQQQGDTANAIETYKRFLREYPASPRASAARRQIERLGGSVEGSGKEPGKEQGGTEPPPADEPPPAEETP
jgi:tetratricopeptide (TPR) repeat protein